jgi:hypothetical protein
MMALRKPKPPPTRSLVIELAEPELLRLVGDAHAHNLDTHTHATGILREYLAQVDVGGPCVR